MKSLAIGGAIFTVMMAIAWYGGVDIFSRGDRQAVWAIIAVALAFGGALMSKIE